MAASEAEALAMLTSLGEIQPSMGCVTDTQALHLLQKMLQRAEGSAAAAESTAGAEVKSSEASGNGDEGSASSEWGKGKAEEMSAMSEPSPHRPCSPKPPRCSLAL